ncbi:MAG: YtxH domain-containing protein [Nitrospira sp.]|nr:YtxH domain-containing protein [Nitrospira sp.]MDH5496650.1 YtxH domain-containing protein [Nitrospira sp.]
MTEGRCGLMEVGLSFLVGCVVGGTAALLYAPQSGTRTRRRIADFAEDVRDRAGDVTEQATEKFQKATEQATEKIHSAKEQASEKFQKAIERGRNFVNT